MHIVDKLYNITDVKEKLSQQISRTGQTTEYKKFREYSTLIENISLSGIVSQSDINICTNKIISINGENA